MALLASCWIVLLIGAVAQGQQTEPPPLHAQFASTARASSGYGGQKGTPAYPNPPGFDGDGCVPARALKPPAGCDGPVINRIWYDGVNKRIAQTNPDLKVNATLEKSTTEVVRFDETPPLDLLLEPFFNETVCYAQPLHVTCMNNGSDTCLGTWAAFGQPWNGHGSYANSSLLSETADAQAWQHQHVQATMVPNGKGGVFHVNITRNYTWYVGKEPDADGRRALLRYEFTQSIPCHRDGQGHQHLNPPGSLNRDCGVVDYTQDYVSGAEAVSGADVFAPPQGVQSCVPIEAAGARARELTERLPLFGDE